jgi:hypothetical protein
MIVKYDKHHNSPFIFLCIKRQCDFDNWNRLREEDRSKTLYDSVDSQILILDNDFLLYPVHDYKGIDKYFVSLSLSLFLITVYYFHRV